MITFFYVLGHLFAIVGLVVLFFDSLVGIGLILFGVGLSIVVEFEVQHTANSVIVDRLTGISQELEQIKWAMEKRP